MMDVFEYCLTLKNQLQRFWLMNHKLIPAKLKLPAC